MNETKTALVTGIDGSIIARKICTSLLQAGYEVVASSEGEYNSCEDARKAFDSEHTDFTPVVFETVDFNSPEDTADFISRISNRRYDVVVNCAATLAFMPNGKLRNEAFRFDYLEFNRVLQYNVGTVAAICFGLQSKINRGGTIVNVTSSAAKEGGFATASYNASKAAVDSLTKSLANILGMSRGIRVNSIAPGWIPANGDVAAKGVVALANAITPSLLRGDPSYVVAAVHYLIENKFQNGSIIEVDGGITSSYIPYMLESLELEGLIGDETINSVTSLLEGGKKKFS